MSRATFLMVAILVVGWVSTSEAEAVKHSELDFELTVPRDFKDFPKGKTESDTLCAFVSYRRGGLSAPMVILVDRMHERVRDHRFTDTDITLGRAFADLPPNTEMAALRGTWKDFEINIVRLRMIDNDGPITTFVAQVPLKSEAIMIAVAANRGLEDESRKVLDEVLTHLEGEGQWASKAEWWLKPKNLLIVGGVFAAIVGFKWLVRRD